MADAGHLISIGGRLTVVLVTDPWQDGELRARVLTCERHRAIGHYPVRALVLLPDSPAVPPADCGDRTDARPRAGERS
jgi:hypothetical protein